MRADPRVGSELAGYRVVAVIGRGGMAVVYLAEHLRLGRLVALKILDPALAEDETFRDRFIRESRIAAGLDHPNVVTVFDAGEADGVLYLSMRYVEGSDLERLLRAETRLDPPRAISILSQAASALDAAHAQGLVHRDVKPGNILLSSEREGLTDRVYLSDFGVTKRMHSGSGLTRTGQFVGTVDYVAPEQIRGEDVDGRADVYSLGCVLYRCLTGEVPFARQTEIGTIYAHLQDAPTRPTKLWPELPADFDGVVSRALAKSRDERFPTCRGLAEASGVAAGPRGATATPPISVPERVGGEARHRAPRPARRRSRLVWTGVIGGAIALAATAVVLTVLLRSSPGEKGSASPGPTAVLPHLSWSQSADVRNVLGGAQNQGLVSAVTVGGTIVAVGHDAAGGDLNAAAWTSPNATRWRRARSDQFGGPGIQAMESVATSSGGDVVAVGAAKVVGDTDPAVWLSADAGATWQRVDPFTMHETGNQLMHGVTDASGSLWAFGHNATGLSLDAAVWQSGDGRIWTRLSAGSFDGSGHEEMLSGTAFQEGLVVVGYDTSSSGDRDAAVWVETGGSWSRVTDSSLGGVGDQWMNGIVAGGPGLVAVGVDSSGGDDSAAVWTSADGTSWDRVPTDESVFGGTGAQRMQAVVKVGSALVAGGLSQTLEGDTNGAIWLSGDGVHWIRQGPETPAASALGGLGQQRINSLVVSRGRLVAVGTKTRSQDDQGAAWSAPIRFPPQS